MKKKIFNVTKKDLKNIKINDLQDGTVIYINEKYCLTLKIGKYKSAKYPFVFCSTLENINTWKFIDPAFWPIYINNFIHNYN